MAVLTKDQIIGSHDITVKVIEVPEWRGDVYVKIMSGAERDAFDASMRDPEGNPLRDGFRAKLAACVLCDAEGNRLFNPADILELGKKSSLALDRIVSAATTLNRFGEESIGEMEKNSESDQSGASG